MASKNLNKGCLYSKANKEMKVEFTFNPKEFVVEKSNQYAEMNIPGLSSSIFQFVRGNARSITLDLLFDTYEDNTDVRLFTDVITGWDAGAIKSKLASGQGKGLMDIDSGLHAPPVCIFEWGTFIFECIIERVSKRFTLFLKDGTPVRATLNVTMKEYRPVEEYIRETAKESADLTKRRVAIQGDSLWSIAHKEYGNSADWRLIAKENAIDNPRILEPGRELVIPVKEQ